MHNFKFTLRPVTFILALVLLQGIVQAQTMSQDTAKTLRVSGYIQTQFQYTNSVDSVSMITYSAGTFPRYVNNRFSIRRGRLRFDYQKKEFGGAFSFDVTERGFSVKDAYFKATDPWVGMFSLQTGVFARPFGNEIALSSRLRESPERARITQTLFPDIRDLGAMLTIQHPDSNCNWLKLQAGIFNGNGSALESDNIKDIVGRLSISSPFDSDVFDFEVGVSHYNGGFSHKYNIDGNALNYRYIYKLEQAEDTVKAFTQDLSLMEIDSLVTLGDRSMDAGVKVDRIYYAVDAQASVNAPWGKLAVRGTYMWGEQPVQVNNFGDIYTLHSHSPTGPFLGVSWPKYVSPQPYDPFHVKYTSAPHHTMIRNFNGGFLYVTQDIAKTGVQVVFKYDFYDPNTDIEGTEINDHLYHSTPGDTNSIMIPRLVSPADIKYTTMGFGVNWQVTEQFKVMAYYDRVRNELTDLPPFDDSFISQGKYPNEGWQNDQMDDVFTLRLQYTF